MNINRQNPREGYPIIQILKSRPQAVAFLEGSRAAPRLSGLVRFYTTGAGTLVYAEITGLPKGSACGEKVFGFHIHEGYSCGGGAGDPFAYAMAHFNPGGCPHPFHAGDLPPLFGCDGIAVSVFLTDRFTVDDVINRTVIIHADPDDFSTQPSGGAGERIACGKITPTARQR